MLKYKIFLPFLAEPAFIDAGDVDTDDHGRLVFVRGRETIAVFTKWDGWVVAEDLCKLDKGDNEAK